MILHIYSFKTKIPIQVFSFSNRMFQVIFDSSMIMNVVVT